MRKSPEQVSEADVGGRRFWHPKIQICPLNRLRPSMRNARTHSKKQREKLLAIIRRFGFINPILIDESGNILAGHLRRAVAEELGMKEVPVIQITHLTDVEKRALALAENRIALDAGWDRETLAAELGELAVLLPDAEIDLSITGFDIAETDMIIADHSDPSEMAREDQVPDPGPSVSQLGDSWISTASMAVTLATPLHTRGSCADRPPQWCSRTHPITSRSKLTRVVAVGSLSMNSQWPLGRCPTEPISDSSTGLWTHLR